MVFETFDGQQDAPTIDNETIKRLLEDATREKGSCDATNLPKITEEQRERQIDDAIRVAEDHLNVGAFDGDFRFRPGPLHDTAKDLQACLLKGDSKELSELIKELSPEEMKQVAALLDKNFARMGTGFSVSLDDEGHLVLMDENTKRGILFDGQSMSIVGRSPGGKLFHEKCFDPDSQVRILDTLRARVISSDPGYRPLAVQSDNASTPAVAVLPQLSIIYQSH
jgi:hypothetical protein